jgi:hypothetical protein
MRSRRPLDCGQPQLESLGSDEHDNASFSIDYNFRHVGRSRNPRLGQQRQNTFRVEIRRREIASSSSCA